LRSLAEGLVGLRAWSQPVWERVGICIGRGTPASGC
jgi:hypothetical protein